MNLQILKKNFFFSYFNALGSQKIGFYFSFFLHFLILLLAIGIPNIFDPKPINVATIIPIEIINITDVTSVPEQNKKIKNNNKESTVKKSKSKEKIEEKKLVNEIQENKKFNNAQNQEIRKVDIKSKPEKIIQKDNEIALTKDEKIIIKKNKPVVELEQKKRKIIEDDVESLPSKKIKPKIKPKPEDNSNLDSSEKDIMVKIKPKPQPEFNIASMLKDLRNDTTSVSKVTNEEIVKKNENTQKNESNKENQQLSISEIDILIQQLSSCWNAPAGAVIQKGMVVRVGAKIKPNRRILDNSVRIIDTNISKSNPFYGPITESAMRTLLNPECTPLKLPSEKYELWKNLTITFDHSIMKGY